MQESFEYFNLRTFLPKKALSKHQYCFSDKSAVIFFSSGTTGPPKAVVLSNQALIANIDVVRNVQGDGCAQHRMVCLGHDDVICGVLPYFHAGGLLTTFGLLGLGVQIVVNRKFDGQLFLEILHKFSVDALQSLKYIFVGSAHIEMKLIQMINRRLPKTNVIQCKLIFLRFS
ncbi:unnamed protein product [Gongylonema pulchrum]|uniref:AMP-binding domain-containing protein n=1 Tax=Gongylonema pulchrum TaxID=637853 RepID=A0A183D4S7_9BILA|nr:unnamed protein product [Gongylonema pulchrum]